MSDTAGAEIADDTKASPDIEARARAQGWRPKEEFKGDASKWKDAETFVQVADQFMPVAIQQNRTLSDKLHQTTEQLQGVTKQLDEMRQTFNDYREFASRGEKRAYDKALKDLMAQRDVAVQHADVETFKAVDAEIAQLQESGKPVEVKPATEKPAAAAAVPVVVPEITAWIDENPWFNRDTELTEYAKAQDQYIGKTKPGLSWKQRLAMVKERTMKEFPDKFDNPRQEGANSVASPSGGAPRRQTNKKSYENLPPEAKAACDKFVRDGAKWAKPFTREEYVANYEWPE